MPIDVLTNHDLFIAVNKPAGMIVHRSELADDNAPDLLTQLQAQQGYSLHPVHRLDRPTSGVMLFAKSSSACALLQEALQSATKTYLLVCRGHIAAPGTVDHPLKRIYDSPHDKRKRKKGLASPINYQDAVTHYQPTALTELDAAIDKYPTSRYSLVNATIDSGRRHQIRRHFKHLSHPIIGCPKYGKSTHNRYFAEQLGINRLLLHSQSIELRLAGETLNLIAPLDDQFQLAVDLFK